MSSATDSSLRRDSVDFSLPQHSSSMIDIGSSGGGAFTVLFRLVSAEHSPSQRLQPITPLHTPFTQSPVTSPAQGAGALYPMPLMAGGERGPMLYPVPSPSMGPMGSSTHPIPSNGVYYTAASHAAFMRPPTGGLHFSGLEGMDQVQQVKARAMSAEVHHSPPFHYVHPQPHRSSFCLPLESGADMTLVSEEMLLSAMPERYDD